MSSPVSSRPSSPTPTPSTFTTSKILSAQLDSQIAQLNTQIASIRHQKQSLSSALLASSTVRKIVQAKAQAQKTIQNDDPMDSQEDSSSSTYRRLQEAVAKQQSRNDIKVHRLMNHVTSFPFTDPAPDRQSTGEASMLGLRFEMPSAPLSLRDPERQLRTPAQDEGTTPLDRIFLVMLRRIQRGGMTYLRFEPEMNTIPKHIDVEGFAARYLSIPDIADDPNIDRAASVPSSESFQDDSGIDVTQDLTHLINPTHATTTTTTLPISIPIPPLNPTQNLQTFTSTTLHALLSWSNRTAHLTHLLTTLGTPPKHHITTITFDLPATKLSIDWANGTTGLLGINEVGDVVIARVFGPRMGRGDEDEDEEVVYGDRDGEGEGDEKRAGGTYRCHGIERRLEGVWIGGLRGRLREIGEGMG